MRVILHMAISVDGFIARTDGDSGWVSELDERLFSERCAEAGCVIVGRRTFEQYRGVIYPVKQALNIILSRGLEAGATEDALLARSPEEALALAGKRGFSSVVVAGGGEVGAAFLRAGLLDQIYLTMHPLILGRGIRLFQGLNAEVKFATSEIKSLGAGIAELSYVP